MRKSSARPRHGIAAALVALVLTITGAGVGATPAVAAETYGSISGKVTAPAGAKIFVSPRNATTTWNGVYVAANGTYTLPSVPAGKYTLEFRDYSSASKTYHPVLTEWWNNKTTLASATYFTLAGGQKLTNMNATLVKGGVITGRLTVPSGSSSVPAVGARAYVVPEGSNVMAQVDVTPSDANGNYMISRIPAGRYTLGVQAGSAGAKTWPSTPRGGVITVSTGAITSGVDLSLTGPPISITSFAISGNPAVGEWLYTRLNVSPYDAAVTYRWSADGAVISGATGSEFRLTSAQAGKAITVEVTATAANHATTKAKTPASARVIAPGTVGISGVTKVGGVVAAATASWTPGTVFTYQWASRNVDIPGATGRTFTVTGAQADGSLSVKATGTQAGYGTATVTAWAPYKTAVTSAPTISGTRAVGGTLTATPGSWGSGTTFTYRWYADGTAISGATAKTFKLTSTQAGRSITVKVTGTQSAYPTVTETSAATGKVVTRGTATVSGTTKVGGTLTANPGTWTPGTTFTYQWSANGTAIAGATAKTLKLASAQAGKKLSVVVTGRQQGYSTATSTSSATATKVATTSVPKVSGTVAVGITLTATPGTWTSGTALSYRWYADGTAISGATAKTFKLTSAQAGRAITVKVTGKLSGYPTVTETSTATAKVISRGAPKVTGTAKAGSTLTASPGTWTAGTTFTYQWSANGTAIAGATGKTFTLTSAQVGKKVRVTVTGKKSGYATAKSTSAETTTVTAR